MLTRMTMTVEKFRELAALRKVPGANLGARYSTAERRWAVEYARQPGMNANRAARELGISDVTMRIWMRAAKPAAILRPVVVTTEESEPSAASTPRSIASTRVAGTRSSPSSSTALRASSWSMATRRTPPRHACSGVASASRAIATHVRVENPLFSHTLFPIYVAVFVWGGLALRDRRVRALLLPERGV